MKRRFAIFLAFGRNCAACQGAKSERGPMRPDVNLKIAVEGILNGLFFYFVVLMEWAWRCAETHAT